MSVPDTPAPLPRPLLGRLGDRPDRDATDPDLLARDMTVLRDSGYLKLAVPASLGGAGFNLRQVACAQRQLAARAPAAALAVTGRRRSPLPKGISQASAGALLASADRRRPAGRRDYAVLVMLLRLGLRASEATALTLEDIDWRAGEITVHGKGRRDERLPLPADVGQAIAAYLPRGRPVTGRREVFLRTVAPAGPLTRGGISYIVRRACRRAGIPPIGAHRLRHTAACEMAEAGVPLTEIGQVLRHKSLASTANYARVSVTELRKLALPWPSGGAQA